MIGSIVGSPTWAVVAAIVLVVCFVLTYYILIHDPRPRTPGPGHPAYEGDEDDEP